MTSKDDGVHGPLRTLLKKRQARRSRSGSSWLGCWGLVWFAVRSVLYGNMRQRFAYPTDHHWSLVERASQSTRTVRAGPCFVSAPEIRFGNSLLYELNMQLLLSLLRVLVAFGYAYKTKHTQNGEECHTDTVCFAGC